MTVVVRSVGIDLVRVIGIVAVVAGHVWSTDLANKLFFPWHVPLFFFLTGWFWTPGRSVSSELRGRWRSLLRPYATWFVIIGLAWFPWAIVNGWSNAPADLVRPFLGGQYIGRPYSAFWFVTALAVAAAALRTLERFPRWVTWTIALSATATATVAPQVLRLPPASAGTALAALVFVLAGTTVRRWSPRVPRPAAVGTVLLAIGATSVALGSAPLDLKQADFGTPVLSAVTGLMLCSGLVLVGSAWDRLIPPRAAALVSRLATCGITVVLLHAAIIWVAEPLVSAPWVFAAAVVIPWATALVLERTPVAPFFVGTPRRTPITWRPTPASARLDTGAR